jgi:short-subunit dehydrogenase
VRAFTVSLSEEIDNPNIRVIAFNPGLVYTDLVEQVSTVPGSEDRLSVFSRVLALLGNPPEVPAQRAVWLATDEGRRAGVEHRLMSMPRLAIVAFVRAVSMLLGKRETDHPVSIEVLQPATPPYQPDFDEEKP